MRLRAYAIHTGDHWTAITAEPVPEFSAARGVSPGGSTLELAYPRVTGATKAEALEKLSALIAGRLAHLKKHGVTVEQEEFEFTE